MARASTEQTLLLHHLTGPKYIYNQRIVIIAENPILIIREFCANAKDT